ncbi:cytochrome P450 [Russula dissimulans]|nr:cytochrome P450 [Russula dissimulans]
MADDSMLDVSFLAGFLIFIFLLITWYRSGDSQLNALSTVGFSDPILSYLSAFRCNILGGTLMIKEGYEKFKPGLFKIPTFKRWMVLPTSSELIEDVRKAPDHMLSVNEAFKEFLQMDYTLNYLNEQDMYHKDVIRSKMTRNITTTFDQVEDELQMALREWIPTTGNEWVRVAIIPALQRIICRISNRVFVGNPLYFSVDFVNSALVISMFPRPLKRPMVEERFTKMEESGDTWNDAPDIIVAHAMETQDDMLMWLMSEAKGVERSLEGLARRMLLLNFASIRATSFTVTQVLYRLLSHPQYIEPLRQEIEAAVAEEGWTKTGMDKMQNLDSFLREIQRIDGLGLGSAVSSLCNAVVDVCRSSDVISSRMTAIHIFEWRDHPAGAVHSSGEIYANPEEFDGLRFSKLRDKEGDVLSTAHRAVTTSSEMVAFGFGRHAWRVFKTTPVSHLKQLEHRLTYSPGRFFAVNEIKALLAHIIMTYDFRFDEGKGAPPHLCAGLFRSPRNADILFRKRQK